MARVTDETVRHVARLAHLSLTPEEEQAFARQLEQILTYADSIQALDTAAVEPMSHAATLAAFRDDTPRQGLDQERALADAPDASAGLFRVPRILPG